MAKTLTEQWREGTLPDGAYYILVDKYEQNEPEIDVGICYNSNFEWWIVKEVLAPVPSYEEWKEISESEDQAHAHLQDEREKNMCLEESVRILSKQLEIAIKALERYDNRLNWDIRGVSFMKYNKGFTIARKALKEMEGVK